MVGIIIFVILTILTTVGWIQIITKAGYSPWWVLLPLSIPVLWLISTYLLFDAFSGIGTYSAFNLQTMADGEETIAVFIFIDVILNFIMFLVFAFSDWPVMQAARSGRSYPSGPSGIRGRGSPGPRPGLAGGPAPIVTGQSRPNLEGQSPGWHRSGPMGAGEQSYWDGSAWTARRRWQNNDWVDLPPPLPPEAVVTESQPDSPGSGPGPGPGPK